MALDNYTHIIVSARNPKQEYIVVIYTSLGLLRLLLSVTYTKLVFPFFDIFNGGKVK